MNVLHDFGALGRQAPEDEADKKTKLMAMAMAMALAKAMAITDLKDAFRQFLQRIFCSNPSSKPPTPSTVMRLAVSNERYLL